MGRNISKYCFLVLQMILIHLMIHLLEYMIQKESGWTGNMMTMIVLLMLFGAVKYITVWSSKYLNQ